MQLIPEQIAAIERATETTIRALLKLIVTYKLYSRLVSQGQENWREVEENLSVNYDLRGSALNLRRDELDDRKIIRSYLVDPMEIIDQIGSFPLAAAVASYAFNQLDECGNFVAFTLGVGRKEPPVAWHNAVHAKMHPDDQNALEAAQKKLAETFGFADGQISEEVVKSFVNAKRQRNIFVHQGKGISDLSSFIEDIIRVIAGIAFATSADLDFLKVYPYTSYEDGFIEDT